MPTDRHSIFNAICVRVCFSFWVISVVQMCGCHKCSEHSVFNTRGEARPEILLVGILDNRIWLGPRVINVEMAELV